MGKGLGRSQEPPDECPRWGWSRGRFGCGLGWAGLGWHGLRSLLGLCHQGFNVDRGPFALGPLCLPARFALNALLALVGDDFIKVLRGEVGELVYGVVGEDGHQVGEVGWGPRGFVGHSGNSSYVCLAMNRQVGGAGWKIIKVSNPPEILRHS